MRKLTGRVGQPDGSIRGSTVSLDGANIDSVTDGGEGHLIAPGIVDLHGDAFERQLMPRSGVHFATDLALLDTDRQLVANGITTAFLGLTVSWEPGLRGIEAARRFLPEFARVRPLLSADTRLHLRHETRNIEAVDEIAGWIDAGAVDLLAFNDHVADTAAKFARGRIATFLGRSGLSEVEYRALLDRVSAQDEAANDASERLARDAADRAIPMASHDDESPEMRRWYHERGCTICEFPINRDTAVAARDLGDAIVLGAPNILRGGSHAGRLPARESVADGLCHTLTSDYYYPSQLAAAFKLAQDGVLPLGKAWQLVAADAARAVRLTDRGEISPGKRADIVVVDDSRPTLPRVAATFVAGQLVYAGPGWRGFDA